MLLAIVLCLYGEPVGSHLPPRVEQARKAARVLLLSAGVRPGMDKSEVDDLLREEGEIFAITASSYSIRYPGGFCVEVENFVIRRRGCRVLSVNRPPLLKVLAELWQ
jgi:hypothetical protein